MRFPQLITFLAVFAVAVFAQNDRGTITGTISDPGNAIVPGAAVHLRNVQTGAEYDTVTTVTGNYTLPSLPVGMYDLEVSAPGFARYVQRGLRVQVAQTGRVNVVLQVGTTTESITVNADVPLLRTESAEQSQTVSVDHINDLPLTVASAGLRNPIAFATLVPGASIPSGGNLRLRVNGAQVNTYKTLLDGQDITSGIDPTHLSELQPSVEALQEVTLQSSNFSAEFGQVAGGLVNFTSRSGTNAFHGSAYEYYSNEHFDAGRPYTDDGSGNLVRPTNRNNNFAFTVGGPVRIPKLYDGRDKTFFFFSYEYFRKRNQASGTFNVVPTDAYRQGNFAEALTGKVLGTDPLGRQILENTIYDPTSERVFNGQIIRDPFANNTIPKSMMDPVALKIQALLPTATNSDLINNLAVTEETSTTSSIPSLKLDHNFSPSTKLSFYWGKWANDVPKNAADGYPWPISRGRNYVTRTHTLRLSLDQTLTPTFLVHLGVGEMRYDHIDSAPPDVLAYDAVGQLGLKGSSTTPSGFPRIDGLSASQGGAASTLGPTNANDYYNDKPTAIWSATWIKGNHSFKFGGEWRRDIWADKNTRGAQGIYTFSSAETGLPYVQQATLNGGAIGFPYASFLLGAVDAASVSNQQDPLIRKHAWGLYAQDTWKLTRKLTLDYGLRWDIEDVWHEMHSRTAALAPNLPNPAAGGLPGATAYEGYGAGRCNCSFTDTYPYALGPRLGIAYQLAPKTVLRGGWGLVYGRTSDSSYITNTAIIGVGFNTLNFTSSSFGDAAVQMRNGLTYNPADLYAATLDPGIRPQAGQINPPPYYIDRSGGRPSRTNQWNIALQRELTQNLVLEAAYVGNRAVWVQADAMLDTNAGTAQRIAAGGFNIANANDRKILTSPWNSSTAKGAGFTAPYADYPTGLTVAQALRPFPQFSNIRSRWVALGNSWYDSLQAKLTKRYSHGLDLTAAFTWQKEESLGYEGVNDIFNRDQNKYLSSYSQPFVFTTGLTYTTPAFGANGMVRAVIRDWTVGSVLGYSSGLPIPAPTAQNALSSLLFRSTYANRVSGQPLFLQDPNCHCIDPNKDFVLNPKAWEDPAAGEWGTAARYYNDYRYQRRPNEQISIGRIFRITESMNFQVRAEFFNVFNRTEMGNPDASNALATQRTSSAGVPTSGFGRINAASLASNPRSGQILARFQW